VFFSIICGAIVGVFWMVRSKRRLFSSLVVHALIPSYADYRSALC
jgi:hypothetical protein